MGSKRAYLLSLKISLAEYVGQRVPQVSNVPDLERFLGFMEKVWLSETGTRFRVTAALEDHHVAFSSEQVAKVVKPRL